jgi:hypothetical protein
VTKKVYQNRLLLVSLRYHVTERCCPGNTFVLHRNRARGAVPERALWAPGLAQRPEHGVTLRMELTPLGLVGGWVVLHEWADDVQVVYR